MIEQYNQEVGQISARLQNMEQNNYQLARQNRSLKILGIITALLITALIVMGQYSFRNNIVEAKGFVLYDDVGRERAKLVMKEGLPLFVLLDKNARERLILTVKDDDPCIVLRNKEGFNQVALFVMNEYPRLIMLDKDNKPIFRAPQE
jgi:hypothetical protein